MILLIISQLNDQFKMENATLAFLGANRKVVEINFVRIHSTNLIFHFFFSLQTEYISKVVPKMVIVHHLISQALFWARLIFQINDEFQSFQTDRLLWQIFRYPNKKVHSICRATCNHKMHSFQRVGSFNEDGG